MKWSWDSREDPAAAFWIQTTIGFIVMGLCCGICGFLAKVLIA